jgi:hypothetical protein
MVLAVGASSAIAVQSQRDGFTAAGGSSASPVVDSPAPSFLCVGAPTEYSASTAVGRIGIADDMFCVDYGNGQVVAAGVMSSGTLQAWLSTEALTAGAVDRSVDRIAFVTQGGEEKTGITEDLYALGPLRGFAFPVRSGGTLVLYRGSTVVARQRIPFPGEDLAVASSSAAVMRWPATAEPSGTPAMRSYPPGESPAHRPAPWPTNARGQTYGSDADANAETGEPDLIAAYATNGKQGYVLRTDVELPPPSNPSEAIAQNTVGPRTIPVYLSDGVTQIGVFVIG